MKKSLIGAITLTVNLFASVHAQEASRSPLADGHPLLGVWRVDLPELKCFEEYEVRADGTKLSMSGQERNESEFVISRVPSEKGFYKWTDKITKNNDLPDCSGTKTPLAGCGNTPPLKLPDHAVASV